MERSGRYGNHGAGDAEVATVRGIYDAFARRDIDAVLANVAEDVEFHPSGTIALTGRAEAYRGHDGMRSYFADAARVWEDLSLTATDIRATAGAVIAFGSISGRTGGKAVRRRVIWTWRLRHGLVVSMRASDLGESEPS